MKQRIIGLDIDEGCVAVTELFKERGRIYLGRYKVCSNLKEVAQDSNFEGAGAVINLPTQMVLFRSFHLSPSFLRSTNKSKDLKQFLLHQNLPFKLEECFWDTFTLNTNLNLIAAKREVTQNYIAQIEELGLQCLGVIPPFVALYNVFIYNYPEREKDGWAILNIRSSASDLIIYEARRLWIYPLSVGNQDLKETPETLVKFPIEVQRIFNAHYLQNPAISQKRANSLSLCGQCSNPQGLVSSLKNALGEPREMSSISRGEFELTVLEPLKKIGFLPGPAITNPPLIALSLGLGLTYLSPISCLKINLIKEKVREEVMSGWRNLLKKVFLSFGFFSLFCLLLIDINLLMNLRKKLAIHKNHRFLISSVLPEAKILKGQKENLQKLRNYLGNRLEQHKLYLKVLAEFSRSKPKYIEIQELEAKMKDGKLSVNLSGIAPVYEEINDFLVNLKKSEYIRNAKVVFSSFPSEEARAIVFKLRFEAE